MFKSLKRRGEKVKERVDFKFAFLATKVPTSGWDKLVVSVVPLETGKATLKTNRANAKGGSCQWPDTIIDTVKLIQDSRTREYDEKLFKFVVSSGSSRAGILGDVTIDVAEYTNSNNPSQISVPLKNCNSGTILHITITCLTPRTGSRDGDRGRTTERNEIALEEDEVLTATDEEDLDDSDKSGTITTGTNGSVASNASVLAPKTVTPVKPSQVSVGSNGSLHRYQKDGPGLQRRPSSDLADNTTLKAVGQNGSGRLLSSDLSPTSSMNSVNSKAESNKLDRERDRDRDRGPYRTSNSHELNGERERERVPFRTSQSQDLNKTPSSVHSSVARGPPTPVSNGYHNKQDSSGRATERGDWGSQRSRPTSDNGRPGQLPLGGKDGLQADLVAAEATIDELRQETVSSQRQNRKLSIEVETLKQQLNAHIRHGAENGIEMTTVITERDRLRLELEQLRSSMMAREEKENGEGNTRWKVEDAERNIRELQEEIMYQKEQSMNLNMQLRKTQDSNMELVLAIKDLEESLEQNRKESEQLTNLNSELQERLGSEHQDSSAQSELEWKLKVSRLAEEKRLLQAQLASIEKSQFSARTDEEHVQKLEKMIEQLTRDVEELENESKELADENMELYTNVERMKKDLLGKTNQISQLEQRLEKSPGTALQARSLPEHSPELIRVKNLVKDLEHKLQASEDAFNNKLERDKDHVEEIQSLVEELRTANTLLEKQLDSGKETSEIAVKELEAMKLELLKTKKVQDEFEIEMLEQKRKFAEERQVLERNLADAREAFEAQEQEVRMMDDAATQAEEDRNNAFNKIAVLEDEILRLKQEAQSMAGAKNLGDGLVSQLQMQRNEMAELKEMAEADCMRMAAQVQVCNAEIANLSQQLATHTVQGLELESKVFELETKKARLESSMQESHEAERLSKSRIEELEFQLSVLSEEMDSVNFSKREFEVHASQLVRENRELEMKLKDFEGKTLLEGEGNKADKVRAEMLEAELSTLQAQMETQSSSRRNLERRASDLQSSKDEIYSQLTDLEEENLKCAEKISELEAQLRLVTEERETHKLERGILETRSVEHQNEKGKFETILQKVAHEHQHKVSDLEAKLGILTQENKMLGISQQDLQAHLQKLENDVVGYMDSIKVLKDRISDLENRNRGLEANLQQVSESYSAASKTSALLEAKLLELHAANEDKAGKFLSDLETMTQSKIELEQRARNAEESVRRTRLEKAAAVDRLQMEVQRLTEQMTSTNDEREKLASRALVEASELRAEKGQWEEKMRHSEEMLKLAEEKCFSFKEEHDSRLQGFVTANEGLRTKEQETSLKLNETLKEIAELKSKQILSTTYIEELDRKMALILNEKEQLEDENDDLKMRVQDSEMLSMEIQRMQGTVRQIKIERDNLDDSAKNLKVLNEYLEDEKIQLEEDVTAWEKENEELRQSKLQLEERILRLQLELDSQGAIRSQEVEQRSESIKLRRQNSEFKRKLTEHEEEKEEFRKRVELLEGELKDRSETLGVVERKLKDKDYDDNGRPVSNGGSPTFLQRTLSRSNSKISPVTNSPLRETKEFTDLREKIKLLEGDLEAKQVAISTLKRDFNAKESILYEKIELLEGANEQLVQGGPDLGMDQLQMELTRLQNLNAVLARRERELLSQLSTQEVLLKEVRRLQEENEQLENRLVRFKDATKFGDVMERVISLETELSEAMESNSMYKTQLQNAFSTQQNVQAAALHNYGDVDKIIADFVQLKKHSTKLDEEVKDLGERYTTMSLRYAEVSAQKEELMMVIRNLRNGKRF